MGIVEDAALAANIEDAPAAGIEPAAGSLPTTVREPTAGRGTTGKVMPRARHREAIWPRGGPQQGAAAVLFDRRAPGA